MVKLPSKANVPPTDFSEYVWIIYGEKGIGKSTLASQFKDIVAYFQLEPRKGLRVPLIPTPGDEFDWQIFKEYIDEIVKKYKVKARTKKTFRVVIDTVDLLALLCEKDHAARNNASSMLNLKDRGKAWDVMLSDWWDTLMLLIKNDIQLTFVSHCRYRPKTIRGMAREDLAKAIQDGIITSETQPSSRGWAYEYMRKPVEFVVYFGWWGDERILQIRGNETTYCSAGTFSEERFLDPKTKKPYHYIPCGRGIKQTYKNLQLAWNNKIEGYIGEEEEEEEYYEEEED